MGNTTRARTLRDGAYLAARAAGADLPELEAKLAEERRELAEISQRLKAKLSPGQTYLRGLFSGGTLCYEAQVIWQDLVKDTVFSNAPLVKEHQLGDSSHSQGHSAIDLGEEEFTVGRPHPMIDNDLRIRRLLQEVRDPQAAVILIDVVLGYGAHPDPASELAAAVVRAKDAAAYSGYEPVFIASITGTEADPQCLSRQVHGLEEAGIVVCESNAAAAYLAAFVVAG